MLQRERVDTDVIKTGRIPEGMRRYGLGREVLKRTAEEAGAVVRIGRTFLINFEKLDEFMDKRSGKE